MRELADWILEDDTFYGKVRLNEGAIEPGQMGSGIVETMVIAVGSGGVANTLIRCLFTWLRKRRDRYTARLVLKDGEGREINLDMNGLTDPDAIISKAFEFFSPDE